MAKRRRSDGEGMSGVEATTAHDAFFCDLLSRVPQDMVVPPAEDVDAWKATKNKKFLKHAKVSAAAKKAAALKAKRRRFDTALTETLSEAQARVEAEETAEGRKRLGLEVEDEAGSNEADEGAAEVGIHGQGKAAIDADTQVESMDSADAAAGEEMAAFLAAETGADAQQLSSIKQLQLKLREKIRKQQTGREGKGKAQERRFKRDEARAKASASSNSGSKTKTKGAAGTKTGKVGSATRKAAVGGADAAAGAQGEGKSEEVPGLMGNSDGMLGIEFGEILLPAGPKKLHFEDATKKGSKVRELRRMLVEAEEKERRLAALGRSEEGAVAAEQQKWRDAEKDAKGERVKDNVGRLKKALKARERKKDKSSKTWDARLKTQEKQQQEAQTKRRDNLQKRKRGQSTSAAPVEKPAKRGRRGAGFEGRKSDFLNGGSKGSRSKPGPKKIGAGAAKGGPGKK